MEMINQITIALYPIHASQRAGESASVSEAGPLPCARRGKHFLGVSMARASMRTHVDRRPIACKGAGVRGSSRAGKIFAGFDDPSRARRELGDAGCGLDVAVVRVAMISACGTSGESVTSSGVRRQGMISSCPDDFHHGSAM